jgi:hypothetical protein
VLLFVYVAVPSSLSLNVTPAGKLVVFQTVAPLGLATVEEKVIVLPYATVRLSVVEIETVVVGVLSNITSIEFDVTELFVAYTVKVVGSV